MSIRRHTEREDISKSGRKGPSRLRFHSGRMPHWMIWLHGQLMNFGAIRPKYRLAGLLETAPFLILGSGRSGNTLLRAMLCAHGEIVIPPESYTITTCLKQFLRYGGHSWNVLCDILVGTFDDHPEFVTWNLDLGPVRMRAKALDQQHRTLANVLELIYLAYRDKHFPKATLWGDKTPVYSLHASWILNIFPNAKIIHLIRDPRASVNSFLKCGMYKRPEDAAWRWRRSHEGVLLASQRLPSDQSIMIHYEDLISEPSQTCRRIAAFLGIPYRSAMLHHHRSGNKLGDVETRSQHANVMKPLNSSSVDKWKDELSRKDVVAVERICRPLLARGMLNR